MALLEAHGLTKMFPIEGGLWRRVVGSVRALKDVSLNIEEGEVLALVGGSGCGKSTLARILAGLMDADSGTILWEGQPLKNFTRKERARKIQMIFQDPYASLNPKLSIRVQLEEVLRGMPTGRRQDPAQLLKAVGLSADSLGHYPFQFSGGQRQRIAIARALALEPQLLIADEPLSALDVSIQAQVLALFQELKRSLGLTLLFITHDLSIASAVASRVVVLQDGQVVEEGTPEAVLRTPRHAYTQALVAAVPHIPHR